MTKIKTAQTRVAVEDGRSLMLVERLETIRAARAMIHDDATVTARADIEDKLAWFDARLIEAAAARVDRVLSSILG